MQFSDVFLLVKERDHDAQLGRSDPGGFV